MAGDIYYALEGYFDVVMLATFLGMGHMGSSFSNKSIFYCNIPVFLLDIKRLNILYILKAAWGVCMYV